MWKRCKFCGEPFPPHPKYDYCCGLCEASANCVVCLVDNSDLDHNCADHPVVDFHEVDGVPTSEPCAGIDKCSDCQDVVRQIEESLNA